MIDTPFGWKARYVPVRFGYQDPDPSYFDDDLIGLRHYIERVGLFPSFTVDEFTRPHHPDLAARLGLGERLIAPRKWWPRYAALLSIAQALRTRLGAPIAIRNAYRPEAYNESVGGAALSDHLLALAFDLDFRSSRHRRVAEEWLLGLREADPWMRMSLGFGNKSIHVGILSTLGSRVWYYASYVP